MEVHQLPYQGAGTAVLHVRSGTRPLDPEATPARVDPDARLLDALRLHEATAAERLVATFGDRAYRLAIGITRNEPDAEEVVQDAFWNVVRKIGTFRGIRLSDRGSIGSSPTPPTKRVEAAHTDGMRFRWTRCFRSSRMMGIMLGRSATGRRASMTRPCRRSFGPRWIQRFESSRPITSP